MKIILFKISQRQNPINFKKVVTPSAKPNFLVFIITKLRKERVKQTFQEYTGSLLDNI